MSIVSKPPARLLMAVLGLSLLGACTKEPAPRAEPVRPVRTVVVQPQSSLAAINLPGEVRPRLETRYGFRVGGKLSERRVSVGDRVQAGTVLARLDPQDLAPQVALQQAQLDAARTELKLAQIDANRTRDLRERNFVSQSQLDRQQAVVDGAQSKVSATQAQLDQARNATAFQVLRAEAEGVVVGVEAEAGQVVSAGQPVIRVALVKDRDVVVNVPEKEMELARRIERWQVSLPATGGNPVPARIREISPLADPASRTYAVRLTLLADVPGAEWGMSAVVQGLRAGEAVFVLPMSVLWSKDGQPHVWRLDPATGTVAPVRVQTAGLLDDGVRIRDGLKAGDVVVTAGANLLIAGQTVRRLDEAAK